MYRMTKYCLMADAEVLDIPNGRIIKSLYESGKEFVLMPRFMWDSLRVDGIDIVSAGSCSCLSFVVKEKPSCKPLCERRGEPSLG